MLMETETKKIDNARMAGEVINTILKKEHVVDRNKEHFYSIGINNNNIIVYIDLVSLGSINGTVAAPREVFRMAVMKGAHRVVLAHNHPSGNLEPSKEDKNITKNLAKAGDILGIEVIDHVVVDGDSNYRSVMYPK